MWTKPLNHKVYFNFPRHKNFSQTSFLGKAQKLRAKRSLKIIPLKPGQIITPYGKLLRFPTKHSLAVFNTNFQLPTLRWFFHF